ncbi:MAG TPA: aminopeptidase [Gaiellaceae bacterium]|nr:aminopeptidase [Gaiellaceae bacterium]
MEERFEALAELAVHGANVQQGQVLAITATIGQEQLVRAIAAVAYKLGALFVDPFFFDPYVKRARIQHANHETLEFVPPWYGARINALGERGAARIGFAGVVAPDALAGLDGGRLGRDQLPWVSESAAVINDRSTNWCAVPCPHPEWAKLVYPELAEDEAYERLWSELWHVLRLDESDPIAAWDTRITALNASAETLNAAQLDAIEFSGPGTELTVGLLASSTWLAGDFETRDGLRHLPNVPTEEVFTAPDPERVDGHVTSTRPLVLKDGTIVRGLRVRFEGGRAVEIDADENGDAIRSRAAVDEGAARLGEVALVDRQGRIGPLGTVFYDTLLDENAASHIALGNAYSFNVEEADRGRLNTSAIHLDFMIGSNEVEVTGLTGGGGRVALLRGGDWQT